MIEIAALLLTRALMETKHKPKKETQLDRIEKENNKLRKQKAEAEKEYARIMHDVNKNTRS
jgi:hypothetical protein